MLKGCGFLFCPLLTARGTGGSLQYFKRFGRITYIPRCVEVEVLNRCRVSHDYLVVLCNLLGHLLGWAILINYWFFRTICWKRYIANQYKFFKKI